MLTLVDGPAAGTYWCHRAPLSLRAVVKGTELNVLDLVTDTPDPDETIHVYRREGPAGTVRICGRGKNAINGWFATGRYVYMPDVDGEQFRSTQAWQAWAKLQVEKEPVHAAAR